ncbi:MAG: TRL domain-containing protein [bacterium]
MNNYKIVVGLALLVVVGLGSGCARGVADLNIQQQSAQYGSLVTMTGGTTLETATKVSGFKMKTGTSSAYSILGLIGLGDASIGAAMDKARISQVKSVSHEQFHILGLYATTEMIVRGK